MEVSEVFYYWNLEAQISMESESNSLDRHMFDEENSSVITSKSRFHGLQRSLIQLHSALSRYMNHESCVRKYTTSSISLIEIVDVFSIFISDLKAHTIK